MAFYATYYQMSPEQIAGLIESPEMWEKLLKSHKGSELDIRNAWHGLHFLLTGSPHPQSTPLSAVVLGGHTLPTCSPGDYAVLCLDQQAVKQSWKALLDLDQDNLWETVDISMFRYYEIMPGHYWIQEDKALKVLREAFQQVYTFFRETASRNLGILITIID